MARISTSHLNRMMWIEVLMYHWVHHSQLCFGISSNDVGENGAVRSASLDAWVLQLLLTIR